VVQHRLPHRPLPSGAREPGLAEHPGAFTYRGSYHREFVVYPGDGLLENRFLRMWLKSGVSPATFMR